MIMRQNRSEKVVWSRKSLKWEKLTYLSSLYHSQVSLFFYSQIRDYEFHLCRLAPLFARPVGRRNLNLYGPETKVSNKIP